MKDDIKTTQENLDQLAAALQAGGFNVNEKEITDLANALETNKPFPDDFPIMQIQDEMPRARLLTASARYDLNRVSKSMTVLEDGEIYKPIYFSLSCREDNIQTAVDRLSQVINEISARGLIHSSLAKLSSIKLVRSPLCIAKAAVFCFVHVPSTVYDQIRKEYAYYGIDEGSVGNCIDKEFPDLTPGEVLAEIRIPHVLSLIQGVLPEKDYLQEEIDKYVAVLPKGTVVRSVTECSLSVMTYKSYEVKFYNPLLQGIAVVELDYVRSCVAFENKLEAFNLLLGVRYMDHTGKDLYGYRKTIMKTITLTPFPIADLSVNYVREFPDKVIAYRVPTHALLGFMLGIDPRTPLERIQDYIRKEEGEVDFKIDESLKYDSRYENLETISVDTIGHDHLTEIANCFNAGKDLINDIAAVQKSGLKTHEKELSETATVGIMRRPDTLSAERFIATEVRVKVQLKKSAAP